MYWNVFYRQSFCLGDKVCVAVSLFDVDDESLVVELFEKNYVGADLLTTSSHYSRELAYKQIYDMGDVIKSHGEFYVPSLMCPSCKQNPINPSSSDKECSFCQYENGETEKRKQFIAKEELYDR